MGLTAKWLALFVFVWIIGIILGSTYDGYATSDMWSGTGTGGYHEAPLTTLQHIIAASQSNEVFETIGNLAFVVLNPSFWMAIFQIATLQFSFIMNTSFIMFYWVFLLPFVCMAILSMGILLYQLVRGNIAFG